MAFQREHQYFDVIGSGFVHEHHGDRSHSLPVDRETRAAGAAWAWLAFYGIAFVATLATSASRTVSVMLASAN